jgi:hypothetical protein
MISFAIDERSIDDIIRPSDTPSVENKTAPKLGEIKMKTVNETTICGMTIKHDNSGVGNNWQRIDADEIPADIREEIAAEMIDGGKSHCETYVATNGLSYRW